MNELRNIELLVVSVVEKKLYRVLVDRIRKVIEGPVDEQRRFILGRG